MTTGRVGTATSILIAIAVLLGLSGSQIAQADGAMPRSSLDSYEWDLVTDDPGWTQRAGLQAARLNGDFYVMGGRTPLSPFIPFASTIFGDVWRSSDRGATWTEVTADAPWPERAYFQAVVSRAQSPRNRDKREKRLFVLGGQSFGPSTFYNDVWRTADGERWKQMTADAGWEGRAGLSAVSFKGKLYVLGGSQGDDAATGGTGRVLFNDVWSSRKGERWKLLTDAAPWAPRAGGVAVVKDGYIYLLGGEDGFICQPENPRCPPYFNDVWRSRNGSDWELVTESADWSPRPGHQCVVIADRFVCFGGFGQDENPNDMWTSRDGTSWKKLGATPWNATGSEQVKYDFDALVAGDRGVNCTRSGPGRSSCSIFTFGGDRERFDLPPQVNFDRVDDDVWRFAAP